MRLPFRNYLKTPMTLFLEPHCEQYEVVAGGEAVVTLTDGYPHSIAVHANNWISVWNEGPDDPIVELFDEHQFSFRTKIQKDK